MQKDAKTEKKIHLQKDQSDLGTSSGDTKDCKSVFICFSEILIYKCQFNVAVRLLTVLGFFFKPI